MFAACRPYVSTPRRRNNDRRAPADRSSPLSIYIRRGVNFHAPSGIDVCDYTIRLAEQSADENSKAPPRGRLARYCRLYYIVRAVLSAVQTYSK